jgi:hypothetical protein
VEREKEECGMAEEGDVGERRREDEEEEVVERCESERERGDEKRW